VDLQLVEFKGLGRGRGFQVVSRRSARDDEALQAAVLERAQAILSSLDPTWVARRQETDIEFLKADLSETERRLEDVGRELAATKKLLGSKDGEPKGLRERLARAEETLRTREAQLRESRRKLAARERSLEEYAAVLQKWKDYASGLQNTLRDRETELAKWKRTAESEGDGVEPGTREFRALASKVQGLLEALGPIFDKAEYIAMDDESFREAYETAERARAAVARAVGASDEEGEPSWE